jgi:hypothetical protein
LNSPFLEALSLEFHDDYVAEFGGTLGIPGGNCLSGALRDILDQSFAVGCNSLTILGGNTNDIRASPEQSQDEPMSSSSQGDANSSSLGQLTEVKIGSAMMLSPPLIDRTMQILGCNPHISDLSLDSNQFPFESGAVYCSPLPYPVFASSRLPFVDVKKTFRTINKTPSEPLWISSHAIPPSPNFVVAIHSIPQVSIDPVTSFLHWNLSTPDPITSHIFSKFQTHFRVSGVSPFTFPCRTRNSPLSVTHSQPSDNVPRISRFVSKCAQYTLASLLGLRLV